MQIRRGDIFYIDGHNIVDGSVQDWNRPAVVVSNNAGNHFSDIVEVVFLTTKKKHPLPTHVNVKAYAMSTALCEQICTIPKHRIGTFIRCCTEKEMKAIDDALKISLGLYEYIGKERRHDGSTGIFGKAEKTS